MPVSDPVPSEPQPTPPEPLTNEEIENEGFDGYDIPPMKPEVVRHMVGIDKDKYAEMKSALDAKDAEIARLRDASRIADEQVDYLRGLLATADAEIARLEAALLVEPPRWEDDRLVKEHGWDSPDRCRKCGESNAAMAAAEEKVAALETHVEMTEERMDESYEEHIADLKILAVTRNALATTESKLSIAVAALEAGKLMSDSLVELALACERYFDTDAPLPEATDIEAALVHAYRDQHAWREALERIKEKS